MDQVTRSKSNQESQELTLVISVVGLVAQIFIWGQIMQLTNQELTLVS